MNAEKNALRLLDNLRKLALNVMYKEVNETDATIFFPFYTYHIERIGNKRHQYAPMLFDVMVDFCDYLTEIMKHDFETDFFTRRRCYVTFRTFIASVEDEIMKGRKR